MKLIGSFKIFLVVMRNINNFFGLVTLTVSANLHFDSDKIIVAVVSRSFKFYQGQGNDNCKDILKATSRILSVIKLLTEIVILTTTPSKQ